MLLKNIGKKEKTEIKQFSAINGSSFSNGSISIFAIVLTTIFALIFLLAVDLCRIFVAREITKNAADAASLSVAQNLMFFENMDCEDVAEKIVKEHGCILTSCICAYDEVIVVAEKKIKFILIDKFASDGSIIQSASRTKVIYPWDDYFDYCRSYKFDY